MEGAKTNRDGGSDEYAQFQHNDTISRLVGFMDKEASNLAALWNQEFG